jgi:hypothetical protein
MFPCAAALSLLAAAAPAQPRAYAARSPDGETEISLAVGDAVTYTVTHRGQALLGPSPISLTLDGGRVLGRRPA